MSSVRVEVRFAFLMNRCRSSSRAVGRFAGSRCRQKLTNSRKVLEKLESSWGGGFLGMRKRTCGGEIGM